MEYHNNEKIINTILSEIDMEQIRPNNERLMPSTGGRHGVLKDKKFNLMLWLNLQAKSKSNLFEMNNEFKSRYIRKKDINFSQLAKQINLMRTTEGGYIHKHTNRNKIARDFKYLMEIGIVKETDEVIFDGDKKGDYFEIQNENVFERYNLFNVGFLKKLNRELAEEELRIYMVYYGFVKFSLSKPYDSSGVCYLTQEQILNRIGYSYNGDNLDKLRVINKNLERLGLIYKENIIISSSTGKVCCTKQVVYPIPYWMTKFYKGKDLSKTTNDYNHQISPKEEKNNLIHNFLKPNFVNISNF